MVQTVLMAKPKYLPCLANYSRTANNGEVHPCFGSTSNAAAVCKNKTRESPVGLMCRIAYIVEALPAIPGTLPKTQSLYVMEMDLTIREIQE